MSVIAWDGKTLAADRQACHGDICFTSAPKIRRLADGRIAGFAGGYGAVEMMVRWLNGGAVESEFPACQKDKESWVSVLVIESDARAFRYEMEPLPFPVDTPVAVGSGREVALGAMLAGADAKRAVEITSQVEIHCGMGVDTLELEVAS